MGWIVFVHQAATLSAQCTLCSDPDYLDTIILMNRESDLPGCGGGPVLSAAARKSLCQHKTQSTFSSQFLSQSGPGQAGKKWAGTCHKCHKCHMSCQIPRIQGKAGVINYKCPEIGCTDTGTQSEVRPLSLPGTGHGGSQCTRVLLILWLRVQFW